LPPKKPEQQPQPPPKIPKGSTKLRVVVGSNFVRAKKHTETNFYGRAILENWKKRKKNLLKRTRKEL